MAGPVGCSFDNYSFPQHAIAKKCRLLLLAGRRRWRWFPQGRRTYRRHGRRDTGGLGTKAQLLKSLGIDLPRSIQPMRFLEFSRRFDDLSDEKIPGSAWAECFGEDRCQDSSAIGPWFPDRRCRGARASGKFFFLAETNATSCGPPTAVTGTSLLLHAVGNCNCRRNSRLGRPCSPVSVRLMAHRQGAARQHAVA